MKRLISAMLLALLLPFLLAGCGGGDGLTPLTITQDGKAHAFRVEVARTGEEQQKGLMGRTTLPKDGGMLFPFAAPKIATFWMKNTLIPLDMIFIRKDGSIDRIAENTVPESLAPVASGGEVVAVLELAGGTAAALGIDESATVSWQDGGAKRP